MNRFIFSIGVGSAISLSGCSELAEQSPIIQQHGSAQASKRSDSSVPPDEVLASDADGTVFGDQFPKVLAVDATLIENKSWQFSVTLSSPYDTPERYADAWRVLDNRGNELGIRILTHDHANEQPFTRSTTIQLADHTGPVFVEGRDQVNGWSGQRFEVELP